MPLLVELEPGAVRQRIAALHLGEVAHVVVGQGGGVARRLAPRLVGQAARRGGAQQADIDVTQFCSVDRRPCRVADLRLVLAEERRELLDLVLHRLVDLGIGVAEQHRDPEVAQLFLLRARQGKRPAAPVDFVGTGDRIHRDLEILGARASGPTTVMSPTLTLPRVWPL
jgi:hypothetical protein